MDTWCGSFPVPDNVYESCYQMKLVHLLQRSDVDYLDVRRMLDGVRSRDIAKSICEDVIGDREGYSKRKIFVIQ